MVETDHTSIAVSSPDVMVISEPTSLHSTEMVDIAASSTAVTAASPRPSIISSIAVMADSDPAQVSSTEMVDTTQLSSAEMADVIPTESSVMIDKTRESAERVETSTLFSTSAEKVATTSQVTKSSTPSTKDRNTSFNIESEIQAIQELKPGERWYEYKKRCNELQYRERIRDESGVPMCTPTGGIYRQVEEIRERNYEKYRGRRDLGHDFWFYLSELKPQDLK